MGKKLLATLVLTGAMVVIPATAALAHDCFIASRSANGSVGASHSDRWALIDVADEFAAVGVTDVEAAMDDWIALGYKSAYAVHTGQLIGEGSNNSNTGNGRGLDYFSDAAALFEDFAAVALANGGSF